MMKSRTVIIGSGVSGLVSALLLARSGREVLVLEQAAQPAPVIRGFQRDGLYFDSGFHYVGGWGEDGPLSCFFRHLGLDELVEKVPFRQEGFDRLQLGDSGRTFDLPVGFDGIRSYLTQEFPEAATQIAAYLDEVENGWRDFPYLDPKLDIRDFSFQTVHAQTLAERLAEFSAWPDLQALLSMHCMLYGVAPELATSRFHGQISGSYYHSVHGVAGGGRSLVEALLQLLREHSVEIRCRAEVADIEEHAGAVSAVVLTSGEKIQATEVVATLNPAKATDLLKNTRLRPAYLKRLRGLRQTPSAFLLFARSRSQLEPLLQRNIFLQQRSGLLDSSVVELEERPLFLARAAQAADAEDSGLIAIVPAAYSEVADWEQGRQQRSSDYLDWKRKTGERLIGLIQDRCPELGELEYLDLATPLTVEAFAHSGAGALYGAGHCVGQYNPQPQTRLGGFYLSGQAVVAPGLLGAIVSAYVSCGMLLGPDLLQGELLTCM